jgi:hypothetical protein
MTKVFVLNDGGHDYSSAEKFGKIVFCTEGFIDRYDVAQMYRELSVCLLGANPDDYILVSSLSSMCMVATAIMVEQFGELHMLIHNGKEYVARDLVLHNRDK